MSGLLSRTRRARLLGRESKPDEAPPRVPGRDDVPDVPEEPDAVL